MNYQSPWFWVGVYFFTLSMIILAFMWYAPYFIEALWIASKVLGIV